MLIVLLKPLVNCIRIKLCILFVVKFLKNQNVQICFLDYFANHSGLRLHVHYQVLRESFFFVSDYLSLIKFTTTVMDNSSPYKEGGHNF